jgi:BirA family biotin operon repressor/biotin-[acetyl-CoA-carboxylase] ligase
MKDLSREKILNTLLRNDTEIEIFEVLDSTSSQLRRMIDGGLDKNAIIIAKKQTAGRGRRGKSFYSSDENGLYFSIGFFPFHSSNFSKPML